MIPNFEKFQQILCITPLQQLHVLSTSYGPTVADTGDTLLVNFQNVMWIKYDLEGIGRIRLIDSHEVTFFVNADGTPALKDVE